MSVGAYGQTIAMHIPSGDIPNLVDISYTYHENRTYDSLSSTIFKRLESSVLTPATREQNNGEIDQFIEGMYNLRLPLSEFNKKGFYTVYIKPKEIEAVITDVSTLTAFPNVRGIVLDINQINNSSIQEKARTNNELVGYRVIYLDEKGTRQPFYRVITSINKCEPVVKAPTSSSDKSYTYRYEDSSSLVFATLSPSSAPSFKGNALPYIGKPTQKILLVNTFFEPIQIDIEMTTHDADTISYMLENSQLRDIDNGLITTYNDKNEIYHQSEHYTLKDQYTGEPVYEVKERRNNNIDFSQTIDGTR
jgi:hypothetical protein